MYRVDERRTISPTTISSARTGSLDPRVCDQPRRKYAKTPAALARKRRRPIPPVFSQVSR